MTRKLSRTCPECAQRFATERLDQTFCTPAHKAAFHQRNSARGRGGLVQLAIAWRTSRNRKDGGPAGQRAFRELCIKLDELAREDKAQGRDAIAYLEQRWRAEGTYEPVSLTRPAAPQTARRRPSARGAIPVVAGIAPSDAISFNQRVLGSSPRGRTIVSPFVGFHRNRLKGHSRHSSAVQMG